MRVITPILLVCTAATLAGCATPAQKANQSLQTTLAQPLMQDSILREGDSLSFQVAVPQLSEKRPTNAQFEAACSSPQLRLLYLDGAARVYPSGPGHYSSPRVLTPELYASLAANPSFTQACAQIARPDWRVVDDQDANNWVLLDRNSITRSNGETRFWGAFDNASILKDVPYDAPYGQKREHLAVSCESGTWKWLAGFDMDGNHRVTDGRVETAAATQQVANANADYKKLFTQVCGDTQQLAKLKAFEPRLKAPVVIALESVQPQVLAALGKVDAGQPKQALKYVRTDGTSTFKGQSKASSEERFISADKASGQMNISLRGEGYESQQVSWRGMIELVGKSTYSGGRGMAESRTTTQLSFTGDWNALPVGAELSYTVESKTLNNIVGTYGGKPQTTRCTVQRELQASEVNPQLSGVAKALDCRIEPDEYQRVNHYYYLADYGYFVSESTDKNKFYYSQYRVTAVK